MSFVLLFVGSIAWAQTPIAAWQLDEGSGTTTGDWSGHSKTGTLVNGPAWITGHSSAALAFDGTDEYVAADGSGVLANLYSTGMTVSAWIKPVVADGRIVDKNNDDFGGWFFKLDGTGVVQFVGNTFGTAAVVRNSADLIAMGTWQHVVATWDGSTNASGVHVYVNGISSDGSGADGSGSVHGDATTPLAIGNRPVDEARGFNGSIDDVRVFNRVLTATEVAALFANDTQAPTAPSSLTATATSAAQINLTWTAATDNIAVTGYLVERCQGASCTNFTQVATPAAASFADTGLAALTTYRYRIRAKDGAANLSGYSNVSSATTSASSSVQALSACCSTRAVARAPRTHRVAARRARWSTVPRGPRGIAEMPLPSTAPMNMYRSMAADRSRICTPRA